MEKEYVQTEQECQKKIDDYNGVCTGCGGELTPMETVDNSHNPTFWSGCEPCAVFDWGVEVEIFNAARYMVLERFHYVYRSHQKPEATSGEDYDYWLATQTKGAVSLLRDVKKAFEANGVVVFLDAETEQAFKQSEIETLRTKVHALTGDGEVMQLFNELLGVNAG